MMTSPFERVWPSVTDVEAVAVYVDPAIVIIESGAVLMVAAVSD
jgi:hypothetical protein